MTLRIGYIGLGALGRHLAGSLLRAGFPLTVYDVDASCAVDLGRAGATCAESIVETARASDTVITCLPSPEAVASVVAEEGGVLEALAPGGTWIDMSTNDAHELQRLATLAAAHGVETLEAPVTGGVHRAAAGMITVLVGGKEAGLRKAPPAFDAMGGRVFYIGRARPGLGDQGDRRTCWPSSTSSPTARRSCWPRRAASTSSWPGT